MGWKNLEILYKDFFWFWNNNKSRFLEIHWLVAKVNADISYINNISHTSIII